ncbi:methylmalonyl Co-A mutase-associated GTPase MeaB [Neolewinella aurantiaca]|uniref:Methylmalonyl Co-A mutase-associated GTPase MeaB n=1 Tax=Neolewinella aurantiaca TaxID=2602767 RepID=A0A5C7FGP9_9BACT|nr:methylmalonyl Co-A mutase-associated GTPase MeaB [Neolewinella aurantiaca]TXF88805.1 methylmalonyl Co-A mutase-associated GTPase MeaB [Neolewinella aurantiaca]
MSSKSINPNLKHQPAQRPVSAASLITELQSPSHRRALGRAITLLESTQPEDRRLADELVNLALQHEPASPTFRLGISGTPGVGKSTFIEHFGLEVANAGHRLAVLAIDPSSSLSGGSILGDKTRMEELTRHPNVFIRPSPTGGHLGGVGAASRAAVLLCEVAGYDYIIVETVGVGQAEWQVHSMTDAFLLLAQPGAGDDLQGIKRGILELADLIAVNKTDRLPEAAKQTALELRRGLHLAPARPDGWTVSVLNISALTGKGLTNILEKLREYASKMEATGYFRTRRATQRVAWLKEHAEHRLLADFRKFMNREVRTTDEPGRILDEHSSLSNTSGVILAKFYQSKHIENKNSET